MMIIANAKAAALYTIVRGLSRSEEGRSFMIDVFFTLLPALVLGVSFLIALYVLVQNATDKMKEEFVYAAAILAGVEFIAAILPEELSGLFLLAELAGMLYIPYKRYHTSVGRAFGVVGMTAGVYVLAFIVLGAVFG